MELCACGSGKIYDMCCHIFISDVAKPITAEQLMRSRYTAYTLGEIEYIIHTTHPSTRGQYNAKSIKEWSGSSVWERLEIISTKKGMLEDEIGYVEFKAYYSDASGKNQIHHEYSTFKKIGTSWFFVEGNAY